MNVNHVISYRKKAKLTQKELAKYIGISTDSYARKERGETEFKESEMLKIAKVINETGLNVEIQHIFFRNDYS